MSPEKALEKNIGNQNGGGLEKEKLIEEARNDFGAMKQKALEAKSKGEYAAPDILDIEPSLIDETEALVWHKFKQGLDSLEKCEELSRIIADLEQKYKDKSIDDPHVNFYMYINNKLVPAHGKYILEELSKNKK